MAALNKNLTIRVSILGPMILGNCHVNQYRTALLSALNLIFYPLYTPYLPCINPGQGNCSANSRCLLSDVMLVQDASEPVHVALTQTFLARSSWSCKSRWKKRRSKTCCVLAFLAILPKLRRAFVPLPVSPRVHLENSCAHFRKESNVALDSNGEISFEACEEYVGIVLKWLQHVSLHHGSD